MLLRIFKADSFLPYEDFMKKQIVALSMVALMLAGCAEPNGRYDDVFSGGSTSEDIFSKQNVGTLLGGAAGAWAGSNIGKGNGNIVATAAGGVLGALLGNQVGRGLDERDELLVGQTTYKALETAPSNQPMAWRNPDNGRYGEVVAQPVYQNNNGSCRDFTQTIFVDGRAETARGTACRNPDGTWKVMP